MAPENTNSPKLPRALVFSTLFPSSSQPNAGVFIRERMFRVGRQLPLFVVAPVAWFPLQGLIRLIKPHFRPETSKREIQQGVEVFHPPFFSIPGLFKRFDGLFLALSTYVFVKKLHKTNQIDIIDAHFAYPDGYAATLLGKWLDIPVTITLRGTEKRHLESALKKPLLRALDNAVRVFSVSDSLKRLVVSAGADKKKIRVVGNGVDVTKFHSLPKNEMRKLLSLPEDAKVIVTVGG
ncbi:MAG TPA: glycosyltransferase family 4 protein, partial [Phycisphaerales bacterium]|nr:glycosyltransferase family 4 protein [Phycisphaerales bacterium]